MSGRKQQTRRALWTTWAECLGAALLCAGGAATQASQPMEFTQTQVSHWAWKAPRMPAIPQVRDAGHQAPTTRHQALTTRHQALTTWVRNPIDAFVLAKLEARGLAPAPPATREELIRRVSFDLTGLPPTLAEIDAFLADRAPNAYEKVVDRYLASPAYGERWARHWLDLARYADTNGFEHDEVRPPECLALPGLRGSFVQRGQAV